MKLMMRTLAQAPLRWAGCGALIVGLGYLTAVADEVAFKGTAAELQHAIDQAPAAATIVCDRSAEPLTISKTIVVEKAITIDGLKARLPEKLGRTPMIIVAADDVSLRHLELHGNYDSVSQDKRAPMIWLQNSRFTVEDCKFYDGSKDGIMVTPIEGGGDIVGGSIRDIEAFRMGRDAVSISGGNQGQKVRNLTVDNVRLSVGYLRGSVEVSDGTDQITVRKVYAEDARYAVDVQDHRGKSAANTNIVIEDVEAVNCRHIIRTANSPRGHNHLTLRRFTGRGCEIPVQISNTANVTVEQLKIDCQPNAKSSPIRLNNCQSVRLVGLVIRGLPQGVDVVRQTDCEGVVIERLERDP